MNICEGRRDGGTTDPTDRAKKSCVYSLYCLLYALTKANRNLPNGKPFTCKNTGESTPKNTKFHFVPTPIYNMGVTKFAKSPLHP